MNRLLIFSLSVLLLFASCGKDRSGEYYSLTEGNTWVYNEMKDKYLWADNLAEPKWKQYFGSTTAFFQTLTGSVRQNDSWSYCLPDSERIDPHSRGFFNHLDSYGMDFVAMNDPTGTTSRSLARVLMVVKGSPAYECGIRRNDFIGYVDGEKVTSNLLTSKMVNGAAHELEVYHLTTKDEAYVWKDTVKLHLPASTYVEERAFPVDTCFKEEKTGVPVAYLLCTRLTPSPDEQSVEGSSYTDDLAFIMKKIKAYAPAEFVLDLRLCNYGTPEMAALLASYVAPADKLGTVFCSTEWNSRYSANNRQYTYDQTKQTDNLQLSRIHVITSSYTQGAAEWVISSLRAGFGADRVTVVGENTRGQGVITQQTSAGFGHKLYPAVAWVKDAEGEALLSGIVPDTVVREQAFLDLSEYGKPNEPLLSVTLERMFRP